MQGIVDHLHASSQHYILMVNPSIAYQQYAPFKRGVEDNIFLLRNNGSIWKGVVWYALFLSQHKHSRLLANRV